MKESATYQAILEEGREEGRTEGALAAFKKILRRQGEKAFGPPDARTAAALERLNDAARLESLIDQIQTAENWQELLGRPTPTQRGRRWSSGKRGPTP